MFTHTDRIMFPAAELTKGDLLAYYEAVADKLLPHLRDRPMTLERFPEELKVTTLATVHRTPIPASF